MRIFIKYYKKKADNDVNISIDALLRLGLYSETLRLT